MKYGTIAEGSNINRDIYRCFECITEEDGRKFVKKFKEQPHDDPDIMHTFYELVVGAFLRREGLPAHYDLEWRGKTPDWSIKGEALTGLVEVAAFHTDRKTREQIRRAIDGTNMYTGWLGSNADRLYCRLQDKAVVYKDLVDKLALGYAVAIFSTFEAVVEIDEVHECVSHEEYGLFALYPQLSGVLFFDESGGTYQFTYIRNACATRALALPSGSFDFGYRHSVGGSW